MVDSVFLKGKAVKVEAKNGFQYWLQVSLPCLLGKKQKPWNWPQRLQKQASMHLALTSYNILPVTVMKIRSYA